MYQLAEEVLGSCSWRRQENKDNHHHHHHQQQQQQLICPRPHRMCPSNANSSNSNFSSSMAESEEELSFEILDILSSRNHCGDQSSVNNPHPYIFGSPPARADNPLVRDAQFMRKTVVISSTNLQQKASCGVSYGSKPLVRIEGFVSKNQDSQCSLPALA